MRIVFITFLVLCVASVLAASAISGVQPSIPYQLETKSHNNLMEGASKMHTVALDTSRAATKATELPNFKKWLIAGVKDGVDLARVSALCAGGEVLSKHVRGKDDRANTWIGSGMAGAVLRLKKGPFEMAKGFGQMFGLVYAVDKILPLQGRSLVDSSDSKA